MPNRLKSKVKKQIYNSWDFTKSSTGGGERVISIPTPPPPPEVELGLPKVVGWSRAPKIIHRPCQGTVMQNIGTCI